MQWKLLGAQQVTTGLILVFCIRQILEKKWEYYVAVHEVFIDFKKLLIQLEGRSWIIFSLSLVTHETGNESD